ncbi:hypothetical protein F4827_002325 [Paraburkholderia bannensis]|uniref:DUF3274 domain-containing protein n=1 Tax=Paraburkholderia bannensis TaxID=765414 RepID=A0A7W9TW28_9BURK|nr:MULTISPECIES: DUF3274 domain-containing protein [Paraburkholderia]MBB3257460.1 hypothetical protein [Paraburkholderia sp. WP4_3_2]MBB6102473.1 hypothetical protein [Paraburkholderia bannensis]
MSQSHNHKVVGRGSAPLYPHRPKDAHVPIDTQHRYPCTTILIHGVNDLGTDFGTVEKGLCKGLNDRLGRTDFSGAEYTHGRMANDGRHVTSADLMKNLDATMYRRSPKADTVSPLIPFYWGFKANKTDLAKDPKDQKRNGQNLDKFGNRLDPNLCKNGGMFANATNNIRDIFDTNFKGGWKTWLLNKGQNDATHPLHACPNRHYMVLAAKRLAALVRQIRLVDPNETVNIIAHSQGTIISLLAQGFLTEGLLGSNGVADRAADTLILIDSPYSLSEEFMDRLTQTGDTQQTTYARAKTLANLVGFVGKATHSKPSLDDLQLKPGHDNFGITGPKWGSKNAVRLTAPTSVTGSQSEKATIAFAERDNRGSVVIYFCPEDSTVGLSGVAGMGTMGLPESVSAAPANGHKETIHLIGGNFRQRVFTRRARDGKPEKVGTDPHQYVMRKDGESPHMTGFWDQWLKRAAVDVGSTRNINAPATGGLAFAPQMDGNTLPGTGTKSLFGRSDADLEAGRQSLDELEASTAISATDLEELPPEPLSWPSFVPGQSGLPSNAEVQESMNKGKDELDQTTVLRVFGTMPPTPGHLMVIRMETPNEGKLRWMNKNRVDSSYHSAVMSGELNHRCATAFDVSIGQARAIDDPDRALALRSMADWRIPLSKTATVGKGAFHQFDSITQQYVVATSDYNTNGVFPSATLVPKAPTPAVGVVGEEVGARHSKFLDALAKSNMGSIPLP